MAAGGGNRSVREVRIRDAAPADLAAVLALNERCVPAMNSLSPDRMEWFLREAETFRVAVAGSSLAGFLICLAPQAPYRSPNFRWARRHCSDFLYIDRVAVSPAYRRWGLASRLYRDAVRQAGPRFTTMACEVNLRPRNEASIRFRRRLGFRAVGSQDHGYVEVRYMTRPLPLC